MEESIVTNDRSGITLRIFMIKLYVIMVCMPYIDHTFLLIILLLDRELVNACIFCQRQFDQVKLNSLQQMSL